jgi:hypothetical protein
MLSSDIHRINGIAGAWVAAGLSWQDAHRFLYIALPSRPTARAGDRLAKSRSPAAMLDWIRLSLRLIAASFQVFLMRDRKQIIKPGHDYRSESPTA